jgi:hypothetical protein
MRKADLGPTPGKQRSDSIRCSNAGGFFKALSAKVSIKNQGAKAVKLSQHLIKTAS